MTSGVITSTLPSGGAILSASITMRPPAPGRFSTMTFWPSDARIFSATIRVIESSPAPGGKPTMILTVLSCASAPPGSAAAPAATVADSTRPRALAPSPPSAASKVLRVVSFVVMPAPSLKLQMYAQSPWLGPASTISAARSTARAFASVSCHSDSGRESYTTPAAAWTLSMPSFNTPVRMAMATSISPE